MEGKSQTTKKLGRGFSAAERVKIEERRAAVIALRKTGASLMEISNSTGICESRVRTILAQERTRIARGL